MEDGRPAGDRVEGGIFAPDYQERPYWWDAASPQRNTFAPTQAEGVFDALIIGGGITGTVAALELARAGAKVLVVDMQAVGEGAARRNAGYIGRTLKRSVSWLEKKLGTGRGVGIYRELNEALERVAQVVADEKLDCHHQVCGRFVAANSPEHLRLLVEDLEDMRRRLGFPFEAVGQSDMPREMASDRYVGGAVIPDLGAIHPGLYHKGLVDRALAAGVAFLEHTEVLGFSREPGQKTVRTSRGAFRANHVVVTTNGYTTRRLRWHARRVVPFNGFVIATEVLPAGLIDRVLPQRRTYLDTKMDIDFVRPAPDSERILFGGMTGTIEDSATAMVPALHRRLTQILPDLDGVRISRAWLGQCAGTFDFMPHIGSRDGVHHALGYNFAGVPIGTSFGSKIAARILGRADGASAFETLTFPSFPLYTGNPWFVPLVMRHFGRKDRKIAGAHAGRIL